MHDKSSNHLIKPADKGDKKAHTEVTRLTFVLTCSSVDTRNKQYQGETKTSFMLDIKITFSLSALYVDQHCSGKLFWVSMVQETSGVSYNVDLCKGRNVLTTN